MKESKSKMKGRRDNWMIFLLREEDKKNRYNKLNKDSMISNRLLT